MIYAVGSVNFLFDRTQRPHLTGDDLSALTGVPKSTLANKANALQVEMLDEVTRAAWRDAEEMKKAAAKEPPRRKGILE